MPPERPRKPTGSRTPNRFTPRNDGSRRSDGPPQREGARGRDRSAGGTSWEKSADWYDRIIGERGSELYREVVIPRSLDLLQPGRGDRVLDIGCGQGVFSRAICECGALVTGIDASRTLIQKARTYPSRTPIRYFDRDAAQLSGLGEFDAASAILCLQNLEHLDKVCLSAASVLKSGGRMLWVLNHPAFRIPRQSSWGFEDERKLQYRRIDAYSSTLSVPIVMHPGKADSESTVSIHRSLESLMAPAFAAGLTLAGFQEWHSHKESQPGPRARAENRGRKEFPLFLGLLWRKG